MKKSRRLFLRGNDYDNELIRDQIKQLEDGAIINPIEIVGGHPHKITYAVTQENEEVLRKSMEDYSLK